MNTGLKFLAIAKRCEIADLRQLASTSDLVLVTGRLVHGLQRERGLSNLFLGAGGTAFESELAAQIAACDALEAALRDALDRRDNDPTRAGASARLFNRIAYVLEGLDALPALRAETAAMRWTSRQVVDAYVRLIAGLLAMVFEAADAASDPDISRLLVALFHFMQGKEFSGQERALGVAMLAGTVELADARQQFAHLVESQDRCERVFTDFASPARAHLAQSVQEPEILAEHERLRRLLLSARLDDPSMRCLGPRWYDCCTARIDAMHRVEERLAGDLLELCRARITMSEAELTDYEAVAGTVAGVAGGGSPAAPRRDRLSFFGGGAVPVAVPDGGGPAARTRHFGPHLERSILDLVVEQTERLQATQAELDAVRKSLNERKLIERAKGVLMAHRKLSEADAHKAMRQMAMNQNRRLIDVAEAILAVADVLPDRAATR